MIILAQTCDSPYPYHVEGLCWTRHVPENSGGVMGIVSSEGFVRCVPENASGGGGGWSRRLSKAEQCVGTW